MKQPSAKAPQTAGLLFFQTLCRPQITLFRFQF